jgi:hypothetical protein
VKLSDLKKSPSTVTEEAIRKTDEYKLLSKSTGEETLLAGCILYLRGDFDSPEAAIAQAKVQMSVAHTAYREMVTKPAKMKWAPSGSLTEPNSNNHFINLILGQGNVNLRNGSATMNCWEAVIVAAMLDGKITNPKPLEIIYTQRPQAFTAELVHALRGEAHPYLPKNLVDRPVKGDVVMFSGLDHVALATGATVAGVAKAPFYPGAQVVSFWPAPRMNNFSSGTLATAEATTIESIYKWVVDVAKSSAKVSFGCPNWKALSQ